MRVWRPVKTRRPSPPSYQLINKSLIGSRLEIKKTIASKYLKYFHSQGFQDIQSELNHCLTCLDDGVEEMETIARPRPSSSSSATNTSKSADDSDQSPTRNCKKNHQHKVQEVDENEEMAKMEKVFEAFITCDFKVDNLCFEDDFVTNTADSTDSQSKEDERELDSEEVGKVKTLLRENYKMESESGNSLSLPASLVCTNVLGKHITPARC